MLFGCFVIVRCLFTQQFQNIHINIFQAFVR